MDKLDPPKALQMDGDLAENWKRFKQRFDLYLEATGASEKEDKTQACLFLHVIGDDALDIYNNFKFDTAGDNVKLDKIKKKFDEYCNPKKNQTFERHKFFTCVQKADENIDSYVNELRTKAKTCEFGDLTDSLIRDRIVCGIRDSRVRDRLLREQDLDLQKAITTCRAAERTSETIKELNQGQKNEEANVNIVRSNGARKKEKPISLTSDRNYRQSYPKKKQPETEKQRACGRCGSVHGFQCPAFGKICKSCGRKNHFAKKCYYRATNVHNINETYENPSDSESAEEFFVDSVEKTHIKTESKYKLKVKTNGKNIKYKLDTGSEVNVLSQNDFNKLIDKPKLHKTKLKLTSYSGDNIPTQGSCMLHLSHKGKCHKLHFIIAKKDVIPILGERSLDKLGLIKRVFTLDMDDTEQKDINKYSGGERSAEDVVGQYNDVFEGLGCLKGEYRIETDETVKPVVTPCRKIPLKLHNKLKAELDRMESEGVICDENEPTEWVSGIVTPMKKNGDIRVCLDPRPLNRAIKREHYKLPTREEVTAQFANAKYFSKLDASKGFWQLRLDQKSSKLTCFNTPFGRKRVLRLPFGIKSAPEVYHRAIHDMFSDIPGVDTSMDDIIVFADTIDDHNHRLKCVLDTARKANLKLNRDKCVFGVQELTFLGDVLSSDGLKPDPVKLQGLIEFQTPQSKKEVQRFLAMINYQGRFFQNLSAKTEPLRKLLEEKNAFVWDKEQEECFSDLKEMLSREPLLKFYDPDKSIKISSDSSKAGLGAVLLHKT